MTEAEWQASDDPAAMLYHAAGGSKGLEGGSEMWLVTARKLRLFAVACCRKSWHVFSDERARRAVEVAERFADGLATPKDRGMAFNTTDVIPHSVQRLPAAACLRSNIAAGAYGLLQAYLNATDGRPAQAHILRDIVGTPHRPVAFRMPPDCDFRSDLWGLASGLAQAAYEERDPETGHLDPVRLAVLADALEEAGCDSEPLLRHLRGWRRCRACAREGGRHAHACVCKPTGGWLPNESPHVRGCWAVDAVLGRE